MDQVRVRFAPSPTGPFHIGGARSALFNFLFARKYGGKVILRIEDTDRERSSRGSEQDIMNSMGWLGITWDEGPDVGGEFGPYRQMERLSIYEKYVQQLFDKGYAYYCYCTEEELEALRQEQMAKGEMVRYTGRCRDLTEEERKAFEAEGRKAVVRFRVPEEEIIKINDLVRGEVSFESSGIGDFVIVKSDGVPTYNFAVVVDDHEMGITHVIRAEEHLSNTPRQVLIYNALGIPLPEFAHISLILGKDHSKMSKRHGATSINQYMELGYLPEALVNFLALLGWAPEGEEEVLSMEELIAGFSLDRVSKSPAVFDLEKLQWLNGLYIRSSDIERITRMALPYYQKAGYASENPDAEEYEKLKIITSAITKYLNCLSEVPQYAEVFFKKDIVFESQEARDLLREEQVPQVLEKLKEKIAAQDSLTPENTKKLLKEITKELKLKGKKVYMPIRIALTGVMHGPELHDLIPVMGAEEVVRRVDRGLHAAWE
ncbi:MAG: glutamate--tRNA ligase [Bacillota bacterium]